MSIKLAGLTAVLAALTATAVPSSVKPLSVALNSPCSLDTDCTSNYCYQTTKQIVNNSPGVCTTQVSDGGACYKDAGCLAGSCINSICQPQAQTFPGFGLTFNKTASGFIGSVSDLAYKAAAKPKPAQPYLTFNKHYVFTADVISSYAVSGPTSIKRNAEIMTTSGAGHKLAVDAYQLVFPPDFPTTYTYYQLRVPSRSNQCITATRVDQRQLTLLYRLAPCQTPRNDFLSGTYPTWALQLWHPNTDIDTTGSKSLPFLNTGDTSRAAQGVAYRAPDGSYSTWGGKIIVDNESDEAKEAVTLWLGPAYSA